MNTLTHNWIDAHCHLADPRMESQLEALLQDARDLGVSAWVQGGVDPKDWDRQKELKGHYGKAIYTCFGLHPWWVAKQNGESLKQALLQLQDELVHADAVGELGLDGMEKFKESFPLQETAMRRQLEIAKDFSKPLVLHIVRSHKEALQILGEFKTSHFTGIIHSFSGTLPDAKAYCDLGFTLSISGTILRDGNAGLASVVKAIPLERIVVETDAPDQSPYMAGGVREKINAPKNLIAFAAGIAKIKGTSTEAVLDQSRENVKALFKGKK